MSLECKLQTPDPGLFLPLADKTHWQSKGNISFTLCSPKPNLKYWGGGFALQRSLGGLMAAYVRRHKGSYILGENGYLESNDYSLNYVDHWWCGPILYFWLKDMDFQWQLCGTPSPHSHAWRRKLLEANPSCSAVEQLKLSFARQSLCLGMEERQRVQESKQAQKAQPCPKESVWVSGHSCLLKMKPAYSDIWHEEGRRGDRGQRLKSGEASSRPEVREKFFPDLLHRQISHSKEVSWEM